ncbi:MAG: alanine racemase [Ruminococcus sp.]|jgi:alanine racemase|nr:alanine racemase [Ruminococcus sp.]
MTGLKLMSNFNSESLCEGYRKDCLRLFAEIDLDAALYNLSELKKLIKPKKTEIMCVIKANGYGHDDTTLCKVLSEAGVRYFAVSNIDEAVKLRKGGCEGEILILGYTHPAYVPKLLEYNIIQTVTGLSHAESLAAEVDPNADSMSPLRIHIKIDTGMGRLGIKLHDFDKALTEVIAISKLPGLKAEGIFTHLAAADSGVSDDIDFTAAQTECFFFLADECERAGVKFIHRHCFNSAGGLMHYDPRSTLARFGVAIYGLKPDVGMKMPVKLVPVMALRSHIVEIKKLFKGETVSYGRTFTAPSDMKIAVVSVGYADGYPRALSSYGNNPNGFMLIHGKPANILGRVCMDQTVVDVTDIDNAAVGSLVTLIGSDGDCKITADGLAVMADTIGYEIVCGIGLRVPRLIYKGGKLIKVIDYYS